MKIKRPNFLLLCNFILFFLELFFVAAVWRLSYTEAEWSNYATWMSIISLVLNVLMMVAMKIPFSDFRLLFVLLSYVFLFGRVWLNFLLPNIEEFWPIENDFRTLDLLKSSVFAACCVQGLFCGLFVNGNRETNLTESAFNKDIALKNTGTILLIFAIPCRLYEDITSIVSVKVTADYSNAVGETGLFDDIAFLIIPGVLCLAESRLFKGWKVLFACMIAYMMTVMALCGDRRYGAAAILAMSAYWMRRREHKKIRPLKAAVLVLSGLLLINFLEVIRKTRVNISENFFTVENLKAVFDLSSVFIDALQEFGISFISLVSVITYVPSFLSYQYGLTFIYSIPSLLPIGFLLGDFFTKASPSTAINLKTHLPVGATLIGDLYANFGVYIVLLMPLAGFILKRIIKDINNKDSGLKVVLYFTKYFMLINLVRCAFFEIFRGTVWCTVIPWVIYTSLNSKKRIINPQRKTAT